jgi:hypothetical protein
LLKTSGAGDSLKALYAKTRKSLKPVKTSTPCEHKMAQQKAPWWDPGRPDQVKEQLAGTGGLLGLGGGAAAGYGGMRHITEPLNETMTQKALRAVRDPLMSAVRADGAMDPKIKLDFAPTRLTDWLSKFLPSGNVVDPTKAIQMRKLLSFVGHKPFRTPMVLGGAGLAGLLGMQAGSAIGGSMGGGYKGTFTGLPK